MDWPNFINKAIMVPFLEKGRDYSGWDCFGLVYRGYRDVLGKDLPSYVETYESTTDLMVLVREFRKGRDLKWEQCEPKVGAVALIFRKSLAVHVGLVMPFQLILHCSERVNTVQESKSEMRIEGYYLPRV